MPLLVNDKVLVTENKLKSQLIQKGFGEKKPTGELVVELKEAIYLLEKGKFPLEDSKGKEVSRETLFKLGEKKEKEFYSKYLVYADLRERGFVVKTGFKFGFDLRVYPRGKRPGEEHSKWVVSVATQRDKLSMTQLSRMVRLSGNIKTVVLQAVVDSEDDINYYELKRLTP